MLLLTYIICDFVYPCSTVLLRILNITINEYDGYLMTHIGHH